LLDELDTLANVGDECRHEGHQLRARLEAMGDDFERAGLLYRELLERERRAGNPTGEAHANWMLANIEYQAGRRDRAVAIGREARERIAQSPDDWAIAMVTRSLAGYLLATHAYDEAERAAIDALAIYAEIDPQSTYAGALLEILATVATTRGAYARAATLAGFANATAQRTGAVAHSSWTRDVHERLDGLLAAALTAGERATLRERGARLSAEEAIALAAARDR
jgi:tetratricopeptide (TPR) repeat protein